MTSSVFRSSVCVRHKKADSQWSLCTFLGVNHVWFQNCVCGFTGLFLARHQLKWLGVGIRCRLHHVVWSGVNGGGW